MKKRLNQFTMSQFIDIACGDYSSIGAKQEEARAIAENIIAQYNDMSDPVSAKARLYEQEKLSRNRCKTVLYATLLNLVNIYKAYDEVREILKTIGSTDVAELEDDKLSARLEQMLKQENFQRDRLEFERSKTEPEKEPTEDEIRSSFDRQTARLMAHFKFAITLERISASVYAHLVNMAIRQQRAQASSSKQVAGK